MPSFNHKGFQGDVDGVTGAYVFTNKEKAIDFYATPFWENAKGIDFERDGNVIAKVEFNVTDTATDYFEIIKKFIDSNLELPK